MPSYLNADRGFGSTKSFMPDTSAVASDNASQRNLYSAEQQRRQQGRQFDANLGFQREGLAQQGALAREGYANQTGIANIQAEASKYPYILKQQRFDKIFPLISGYISDPNKFLSSYNTSSQTGQQPTISDAPIYNDQRIQEQVNATRAQNDAAMASRNAQLQRDAAGRGAGSRSPLVEQLMNSNYAQNLAGNTQAEQQLRFDAAGKNAQQVLAAQKAREEQYANRQNEGIERGKVGVSALSSLLSGISGLV